MIDDVRSTKLPNGIKVLTEHMPGLRSVTAGIWVRRGSRHEAPELNGICHFIEHAVFKGTKGRSARDIAVESDRLGGHLDAFTTHEMTGFAIKVADTSLPQAFDLVADLLAHPRFDQNDLEREQKVILEEMKMVEDTPDELLGELFNAAYFPIIRWDGQSKARGKQFPPSIMKRSLAFMPATFRRRIWWSRRQETLSTTSWSNWLTNLFRTRMAPQRVLVEEAPSAGDANPDRTEERTRASASDYRGALA